MATFTYTPDYGADLSEEPKTLRTQFGDGYAQTVLDGIHTLPKTWSVVFSVRSASEISNIRSFLQANFAGFDWTDPNGTAGRYECLRWSQTKDSFGGERLSAEFKEIFW